MFEAAKHKSSFPDHSECENDFQQQQEHQHQQHQQQHREEVFHEALSDMYQITPWEVTTIESYEMDCILKSLKTPAHHALYTIHHALRQCDYDFELALSHCQHLLKVNHCFIYNTSICIDMTATKGTSEKSIDLQPGVHYNIIQRQKHVPPINNNNNNMNNMKNEWKIVKKSISTKKIINSIQNLISNNNQQKTETKTHLLQKLYFHLWISLGTDVRDGTSTADHALLLSILIPITNQNECQIMNQIMDAFTHIAALEIQRRQTKPSRRSTEILTMVEKIIAAGCTGPYLNKVLHAAKESLPGSQYFEYISKDIFDNLLDLNLWSCHRSLLWLWRKGHVFHKVSKIDRDFALSSVDDILAMDNNPLLKFDDPSLPLVVDVGCGLGVTLIGLAAAAEEGKNVTFLHPKGGGGEEEEEENNEEQKDEEKDEGDADDNTLATDKDKEASDEKVIDTTHIAHNTADLEAVFKAAALELEEEYKQSHNKDANDYTFELSFGCQYKITGLFKTQLADGIMGMENSENSFWMQMYNANMIQNKMFSLCFSNSNEQISKDGTVAGTVSLGGSDTRLHQTPMVYAENDTSNGWYTVYVKGIYLQLKKNKDVDDGKEVKVAEIKQNYSEIYDTVKLDLDIPKLNSRGIILDSGTTHTYLPWFVNELFSDAFEKIYGATFDQISKNITQLIFDIQEGDSDDEFDIDEELPTIVIQFRGATNVTEYDIDDEHQWGLAGHLDDTSPYDTILEIPPTQYLTFSKYKHTIVPKVHLDDTEGFGVLGANSMVGYDVLFDMDNNRVGFAKSDCNPDDLV
mmetsp:Transcript_13518/g.16387  ORF Transcript_13518/g.16387 Transcript_13518/m.16387 type:complete len:802 (+) Transcript_13518:145-2550(+)